MKKCLIIFVLFLAFIMAGCTPTDYDFMHSKEKIECIEIVEAYCDYSTGNGIQTVLVKISDKDSFLKDFQKLECSISWFGGPSGVDTKGIALKFTYENGDYELIRAIGQSEYTKEQDYYKVYCMNGNFDSKEFNKLIFNYSGIDVETYNNALETGDVGDRGLETGDGSMSPLVPQ